MLVISALFFLSVNLIAQDDVLELLPGAEKLEYDENTGIHRLIGNVNFLYQGNKMYCDSAHYFERKQQVRAYGHVHINKRDTLNLFCDSLHYDGLKKEAELWGNVRARDNEYKLTTDKLTYDANTGQAHYNSGGKVESILTQEVLTSRIGYFHPETKNFFFSKNVDYKGKEMTLKTDTLQYVYSQKKTYFYGPTTILSDSSVIYCESGWYNTSTGAGTLEKNAWISRPTEYISGDKLIYNPKASFFEGYGNVYFKDSTQNIDFNGDYAFSSDSLNRSFITGHALATKHLSNDTLYLHADTLFMEQVDSSNVMRAYHGVKIYSTQFQGVADSIAYEPANNIISLNYEPIVWSDEAELKGEYMTINLEDTLIHGINIFRNASIVMEVEKDTYYNQIAGKDIKAYFKNNELVKATATGNAITIFYPEDEEKTDSTYTKNRMGMNRLYASSLRIDLDSSEVTGITYNEKPDGAFYPIDKLNEKEQFIQNFDWKIARRPKSKEAILED